MPVELTTEQHLLVKSAAERLRKEFEGEVNVETIQRLMTDSFDKIMAMARVPQWVPIVTEKFARDRLRALTRLELGDSAKPAILFLCVHNAGRSQMAAGFARHLGGDRVDVFSGGTEPADEINRAAVSAMAEIGIDITKQSPQPWADEIVRAADVIVSMGCGDACPVYPGKKYVDWELEDPAGKPIEEVRPIRDDIRARVEALLEELVPAGTA